MIIMPPKKKPTFNVVKKLPAKKAPPKKKKKFIVKPPESQRRSVPEFMPLKSKKTILARKKFQKKIMLEWKEEIDRLKEMLKTGGRNGGPAVDGAKYNINLDIKELTKQLDYIKSSKYLDLLESRSK